MRSPVALLSVALAGCPTSSWVPPDPDGGGTSTVDADSGPAEPRPPEVDNLAPGERLRYDLALVAGTADPRADAVRVSRGDETIEWPVVEGRFKALVPLEVGANEIRLEAYGEATAIEVTYEPQTNTRFVRLVYVLALDDDGRFDAPEGTDNDVDSAVARIRLGARMLQTFTAEKMNVRGFGRRTFRLLMGEGGQPVVEVIRSDLTTEQAYALGDGLAGHIYEELAVLPSRAESIDLAVLGMSHYDPATGTLLASTAVAFDRLALVGSSVLHTWAATIEEVDDRFVDETKIDTSVLLDDSAGREVAWANYSTTLGASLVLLAYAWGLPLAESYDAFTVRGFDRINRTFVMTEPPSVSGEGLDLIQPADEVGWEESDAVWLRYHRWHGLDARDYAVDTPPIVAIDGADVRVASVAGLRAVVLMVDGRRRGDQDHLGDAPPATVRVPIADLHDRYPEGEIATIRAIDDDGNVGWLDFPL